MYENYVSSSVVHNYEETSSDNKWITWSAMNGTNLRREMGNTNNCDYRVSLIIPIYNKAE